MNRTTELMNQSSPRTHSVPILVLECVVSGAGLAMFVRPWISSSGLTHGVELASFILVFSQCSVEIRRLLKRSGCYHAQVVIISNWWKWILDVRHLLHGENGLLEILRHRKFEVLHSATFVGHGKWGGAGGGRITRLRDKVSIA